jgi:hypothetical protein
MYHVDWSKDSKLRMVSFQGCVTAAEFQAFSKESTQVPARATFIDFSRIEEIGFGFGELSPHAAAVKSLYEDSQILPDEIVLAPKETAYGVARIYQSLLEDICNVRIYRWVDAAKEDWREIVG